MKYTVLRQILVVSCVHVAVLVLGPVVLARSISPVDPGRGLERAEETSSTERAGFTFEGFVVAPDGTPAEGAVVVSSAGGQAVTDAVGAFRLVTRAAFEANSVQITAVGRAGANLLASREVSLHAASGAVWVGPLQLARGSSCTPSWLPTFGGEPGMNQRVHALAVFDDGGGAALYAGGDFTSAGGVAANRVAKWDGSSWAPLAGGTSGTVQALTVFDDGGGEALYAGGWFSTSGGALRVAKWDGSSWTALGSGMNLPVFALTVFDDGGGSALYAGGDFTIAGGAPGQPCREMGRLELDGARKRRVRDGPCPDRVR